MVAPGKKLLFMGGELAQWTEWSVDSSLDWALLAYPNHRGMSRLVRALNHLYVGEAALHHLDFQRDGFEWLDCHDRERTLLSYVRWSRGWQESVAVAVNFTPTRRDDFRMAIPFPGRWRVILNTDAPEFGGAGTAVPAVVNAVPGLLHGRNQYLELPLPGLCALYLKRVGD